MRFPKARSSSSMSSAIAYRAETRMMPVVAQAQGKTQRPRRHLRALFQSDADIIPEPSNAILRIRILGGSELNLTRTIFPGTNLRMVYELPGNTADPEPSGSNR